MPSKKRSLWISQNWDDLMRKIPLPCSYCSNPKFKGWVLGKCPYCGKVRADNPSQDPGEGYRFVNSDEVVLETDDRAYIYHDSEETGLCWGEVDKANWFQAGKTARSLRNSVRANNVVFRRKAVDPAKVATVTVYEVVYGDAISRMEWDRVCREDRLEMLRKAYKYVSVISTKAVEVTL